MNYLFKSSHKVARSYMLFMLRKKKKFVSYLLAYVSISCTCRKKNLHWLAHLLLMTSNLVTIETDHHILSFRKKLKKKTPEKGLATTTAPLVRPRVKLKKNVCWFQYVHHTEKDTVERVANKLQHNLNFLYSIDHTLDWFIVFFIIFFNFPLIVF